MKSAQQALQRIAVHQEHVPGATTLHPARRIVQYLTLLILILIPLSGLFRIDLAAGSMMMLDRQVWFSDFLIILGLWLFIASLLVMMYSVVGSVFCGWMCPQNTVSEYANWLTTRLLGRRADMMDITGAQMQVSRRRKSLLNYLLLAIGLLLPAMLYGLIPLLYFFPAPTIWSLITLSTGADAPGTLYWIYLVFVSVFLLDIAVIRHLLCKYMCMYRIWQHSFKTKDTLHIYYDAQRSDHCTHCNYCVDACFLDIDPRKDEAFDSCVNCGECVTACDDLHGKSKKLDGAGLLSFAMGAHSHTHHRSRLLVSLILHSKPAWLAAIIGALLFAAGLTGYQNNEFSVYQYTTQQAEKGLVYRINIAHKLYDAANITLHIDGLKAADYRLDHDAVHFDSAGRQDVFLHVKRDLPKGLHRFCVLASSDDGWTGSFNMTHFASGIAALRSEHH